MRLTIDDEPNRLQKIGAAIPRLMLAALFGLIGASKLGPASGWILIFDRIGWGQWFRYATGAIQIAGAMLLLSRRTAHFGAVVIAATMAGAVVFDVAVLNVGGAVLIPFVLLAAAIGVGIQTYLNRPGA